MNGNGLDQSERDTKEDATLFQRGYQVEKELGAGAHSKVRRLYHKGKDAHLAVKIICRKKASELATQKYLPRELEILKSVNHFNVIRAHEIVGTPSRIYIIMELAEEGDLEQFINSRGPLSESGPLGILRTMFRQALEAVKYLHGRGIAHRDIKCDNLLLDRFRNLKLADFGFARRCQHQELSSTYCGSLAYTAPEIVRMEPYEPFPTDMWSLGVVLFIMLLGEMPFDESKGPSQLLDQQMNSRTLFKTNRERNPSLCAQNLIRGLLTPEPCERETPIKAIFSDWMKLTPYYNWPHTPLSPPRRNVPISTNPPES